MLEEKNNKKSKQLIDILKGGLKSRAFYNPELKIISYNSKKNNGCKNVWEYIVNKSNDNNEELRRINNLTLPIVNFSRLKGIYLEKIKGYKKI